MAEILYEAYLYETGVDEAQIIELVTRHDELLRQFARYKKRNARMIAQDLEDAATDQDQLEIELVAAFESLGFDATHIGGKGKPDGLAIAYLGARNSESQKYSTILEAKSKQELGKRVSAKSVDISRIAAHREDYACSHAVIVGPDFSTTQGETAALVKDARTNIAETGKTITFMKIRDLARLVRLRAVKHIGLDQIRSLFKCVSPEESSKWVDTLEGMEYSQPRYREILETIWELQKEVPSEAVEFSAVTTSLRIKKGIVLSKTDLIDLCKTLALIVPPEVVMTEFSVELTQRPDIVIEEARKILKQFPEKDQEYLKL